MLPRIFQNQLRIGSSALMIFSISFFCSCQHVLYEFQPNIPFGGRIVALTKSPSNNSDIIAASESGGLFISNNAGKNWKHIQLPVFEMSDVKYSPQNKNIVIATTIRDLKTKNGGGIWHSSNGGKTWSHKLSTGLAQFLNPNFSAYGIAFEPGSQRVYVGTDDGVAISNDNGNNWTFSKVFTAVVPKVYSVVATGGGKAIITTSSGIYKTIDAGVTWTQTSTIYCTSSRGIDLATANNNNVCVSDDAYKIYYSSDFGQTWTRIISPMDTNRVPYKNREQFIRFNNGATTYLYFGDGVDMHRKILPNAGNNPIDFSRQWEKLSADHYDFSDIIFDSGSNPLLLAGDGGCFKTNDGGKSWFSVGSGSNGLTALQINEATAQENFENERQKQVFIYFGTQDNQLWASADGGTTWAGQGNEGHSFQNKRRSVVAQGNLMTFVLDDGNQYYAADKGMTNSRDWAEPPGSRAGDPVIMPSEITDPNPQDRFLQMSSATRFITAGGSLGFNRTVYFFNITNNGGISWKQIASMFKTPTSQYPKLGFKTETVVYQTYGMGSKTSDSVSRIGLVRLSKIGSASGGIVERADLNGFGSLGTFATEFLWYIVYGVDPSDPDHLMIADIENKMIKTSYDGGKNWFTEKRLTDIVTDNGKFKMYSTINCCPRILVTYIAFNPDNSKQIAIGTRENGIFFSWDGGLMWYQLKNTTHISNISSIVFYFDKTLLVSTYGRGLWKVTPKKSDVRTINPAVPFSEGPWQWDARNGDVKRAGAIQGAQGDQEFVLIDTSAVIVLKDISNAQKPFIEIPVAGKNGTIKLRLTQKESGQPVRLRGSADVRVRGVFFGKDSALSGALISSETYKTFTQNEIEVKELKEPYVQFYSTRNEAVLRIQNDDSLLVQGINFQASSLVRIYLNDSLYLASVPVNSDGSFRILIAPPYKKKFVKITASQKTDKEEIQVTQQLPVVRGGDEIPNAEKKKN